MENNDMVRMANQIGTFFKTYGAEEGTKEIATHINNFWEPRMRQKLFAYVDSGGKDLAPLVMSAMASVRRPSP